MRDLPDFVSLNQQRRRFVRGAGLLAATTATPAGSQPAAGAAADVHIEAGGAGKCGPVPMPPFARLTEPQLKSLAEFVLKQ